MGVDLIHGPKVAACCKDRSFARFWRKVGDLADGTGNTEKVLSHGEWHVEQGCEGANEGVGRRFPDESEGVSMDLAMVVVQRPNLSPNMSEAIL